MKFVGTLWFAVLPALLHINVQAVSVARECTVWETVAQTVMAGDHSVWDTVCSRNGACTGINCTNLAERNVGNRDGFHFDPVQFSVDILPCSYPLAMQLSLGRYDAPMFTKQILISSSGHSNLDLPSGSKSANVLKRLEFSWTSTFRPVRYQVELQINYTTYEQTGFIWTTLNQLERINLVPRIVVPVPDCTANLFHTGPRTTVRNHMIGSTSFSSEMFDARQRETHMHLTLTPLFVGIGLAVLTLVLLAGVVLQRHFSAAHRDQCKHRRLVNEYDVDGHMIQV